MPRSGNAESHDNSMFNILRTCQVVFQSGCSIVHPHQPCMTVLISPHPHQHLFCLVFPFFTPNLIKKCDFLLLLLLFDPLMKRLPHKPGVENFSPEININMSKPFISITVISVCSSSQTQTHFRKEFLPTLVGKRQIWKTASSLSSRRSCTQGLPVFLVLWRHEIEEGQSQFT